MTSKKSGERKTKQRSNGSGTVWKEGKIYRWQVTLGYTAAGKRITRSGRANTSRGANLAMAQVQSDYGRGLIGTPEKVTVGEYADRWVKQQIGVSPRTAKRYGEELAYAMKHIGQLKLQEVRTPLLKDLMALLSRAPLEKTGKPMSPRTHAHVRTRLKTMFQDAVADQVIYVNPMDAIKPLKMGRTLSAGQPLDFDEAARLHTIGAALHQAGRLRLWPAVFTAVSIGLRRGEVMGLTWKDVDFTTGILYVRQTRVMGENEIETGLPKTKNSRREIQLPPSLIAALQDHRQAQLAEQAHAGSAWKKTGAVFATELGDWTHPDNLKRAVQTILKWSNPAILKREEGKPWVWKGVPREQRAALMAAVQVGSALPDISPHDLRHTYATLALRRGVPIEVVSRNLGHASISITWDIYRHVLDSERRSHVVDLFEMVPPVPVGIPAALN